MIGQTSSQAAARRARHNGHTHAQPGAVPAAGHDATAPAPPMAPAYLGLVNSILSFLNQHPRLLRALSPLAKAPLLSRLQVLPRAFLGATAFEAHRVDVPHGRISLGGVDEVIFSAKFVELFHTLIAKEVGDARKDALLYEIGRQGGYYEVDTALTNGRWAPRLLIELIDRPGLLGRIRGQRELGRLFDSAMTMAMRLIINEGGWGVVESFDYSSSPIRVVLDHTQEPLWLGPSQKPVCAIASGVVAGYFGRMVQADVHATEVACKAMGAPRCVFELASPSTR